MVTIHQAGFWVTALPAINPFCKLEGAIVQFIETHPNLYIIIIFPEKKKVSLINDHTGPLPLNVTFTELGAVCLFWLGKIYGVKHFRPVFIYMRALLPLDIINAFHFTVSI